MVLARQPVKALRFFDVLFGPVTELRILLLPFRQLTKLLAANRLIDPGSEFRLHRHWFDRSAMDVLLGQDFAVAE